MFRRHAITLPLKIDNAIDPQCCILSYNRPLATPQNRRIVHPMSALESLPSWVGQEVTMLVQQNPQLMDQIQTISRRRAMRACMPIAQDLEPAYVTLPVPLPADRDISLDWAA
jgi:hypothetical protein